MTGWVLGLLAAAVGIWLAVLVGRQDRTPWRPVMLAGIIVVAGFGALGLSGLDQRGVASPVGALMMYGAAVLAAAAMAGRGRG